jgi:hypothetical protein
MIKNVAVVLCSTVFIEFAESGKTLMIPSLGTITSLRRKEIKHLQNGDSAWGIGVLMRNVGQRTTVLDFCVVVA